MYQLNATGNNEWLDWNVLLCIKFIWIYIISKVWTEIILQMQTHWYMRASAVIYDWVFYQSVIGQFVLVGKRFAVAFRVWIQLNTLKVFCVRTRILSRSSIVITDFHLSLHVHFPIYHVYAHSSKYQIAQIEFENYIASGKNRVNDLQRLFKADQIC